VRRRVVEELGGLYEPKSFSIVDALPTTAVGKIDKAALRRRFALRTGDETRDELDPVR
jgi:non-ribosomal peptide synthetase component E (peptide arylation enzyme)